jgi:hypothetical protein
MNRAKYYVAVRPRTNGHHTVHKGGCPFIIENRKGIYLGEFNSGRAAFKESRLHFKKTECCIFCSKGRKKLNFDHVHFNLTKTEFVLKEPRKQGSYQSLIYCVN